MLMCTSDFRFFSFVDGVLGGYGQVTPMDARDSHAFLDRLPLPREASGAGLTTLDSSRLRESGRSADCGAGIGRVARNLLLPRFRSVDLVEQSPRLLAAAQKYLAGAKYSTDSDKAVSVVGEEFSSRVGLLNEGLQVRHRRSHCTRLHCPCPEI
jgi:hypothetical protein